MTSAAIPSVIASEARSLLDRELDDDERLCWVGQPLPGKLARHHTGILFFAIPWTAFMVCHAIGVASTDAPLMLVPELPLLALGAAMLTAPWRAARGAKRTLYAITDRRAIVITPPKGFSLDAALVVRSFTTTQVERRQAKDGSGDLIFEETVTRGAKGGQVRTPVGFLAIADVLDVERLLRREQLLTLSSPPST